MNRNAMIIGACLFVSLWILGCGGGDSGGGGTANLQGTWLGWIEDDEGNVEELSLEIGGAGNVINALIGLAPYGTGHINEGWDENVFHVLDYEGDALGHSIMIVDDQYSHAVYGNYGSADSDYYLGVLEKGTMGLPAYTSSDIVESYPVGGAYEGVGGIWEGENITMTVNLALEFTGNALGESFDGTFDTYDSDYGRYEGTLTRNTLPPEVMDITAFVSPDGTAVAAFATTNTNPTYLEDFILIGLTR